MLCHLRIRKTLSVRNILLLPFLGLGLAMQLAGGLLTQPVYSSSGDDFPDSLSELAPGTYIRDVTIYNWRIDDNGYDIPTVQVGNSKISVECLGKRSNVQEGRNTYRARLKYDGYELKCDFL